MTLGRWLQKLKAVSATRPRDAVLVEVGVCENGSDDGFEVMLADGIWLHVPAGFRDGDLTRLLGVLSAAC